MTENGKTAPQSVVTMQLTASQMEIVEKFVKLFNARAEKGVTYSREFVLNELIEMGAKTRENYWRSQENAERDRKLTIAIKKGLASGEIKSVDDLQRLAAQFKIGGTRVTL